ncbi:lipopolysaccharide-assembly, LptC-related [Mariprofundus micogutta]|uniref:Lipopolysaccharide-assembly, LptC-related n=1 Tax=Mariprofundus micogutta TaxID=1921010 RepID=A0A1L8CN82_9PROT|nr:LPS export ABC transporter periplasmic protein LptC [Mariprofundus micogutta]GAV20367.1 lipopolysaccharide-assembly, LptC-related [Mariprofundus micogutta]
MRFSFWPWLKWASLLLSVGSIVIAITLMWLQSPQEVAVEETQVEKPQTKVESPLIVERKDGKVIWQLKAEEAKQQLDGQMNLVSPTLSLFTQSGDKITIDSKQAWFNPLSRDIRFEDQVNVVYDLWHLTTDMMIYTSATDVLHVPEKFNIKGESMSARGKNMRLHRQREEIIVDEGIWIQDNSSPQWQGAKP